MKRRERESRGWIRIRLYDRSPIDWVWEARVRVAAVPIRWHLRVLIFTVYLAYNVELD